MSQFQSQKSPSSAIVPHGLLAAQSGEFLQLQVVSSGGGYYLGTQSERGPFTLESEESWETHEKALMAWDAGCWTQRSYQ